MGLPSFYFDVVDYRLRHFLTCCGFRLPGEAQRVDRIMTTFAKCYYEDNAGDSQRCPFKHEDTVYLLSFAIIMLNTDLHKSASSQSRPPRKKMNKTEFINNLRGAEQGEEISREYLFMLYDSIEANPIELHPVDASESGSKTEERARALQDMLNNVRSADSLLRGLAVHDFHFATIDDFVSGLDYDVENALGDLSRSCVSKTWHQWHGVINTGLETAHLDPTGMEPCVDILLYALCIAVCLDMPTERAAFLSQLGRLKAFEERRQGRWVSATEHDSYKEESWYLEIEKACTGPTDRKVWALRKIHHYLTGSLKSALKVDVQNKVSMSSIVRQIKDGDYLLQDPSRSFLRAAQLLKKSSRTGRSTSYRFILFSDVLMYASEESGGKFRIHEELPLHLMKVIDWFPPSQKNRKLVFEISHPRKSFFVICSSAKERKSWVQQIKVAITLEMDRKMKVEAARMAAYTGT